MLHPAWYARRGCLYFLQACAGRESPRLSRPARRGSRVAGARRWGRRRCASSQDRRRPVYQERQGRQDFRSAHTSTCLRECPRPGAVRPTSTARILRRTFCSRRARQEARRQAWAARCTPLVGRTFWTQHSCTGQCRSEGPAGTETALRCANAGRAHNRPLRQASSGVSRWQQASHM